MLGHSPERFIGVESLSLIDSNGKFIPRIVYALFPNDGGILSGNSMIITNSCDREPLSVPQEAIHQMSSESGEAIGPISQG